MAGKVTLTNRKPRTKKAKGRTPSPSPYGCCQPPVVLPSPIVREVVVEFPKLTTILSAPFRFVGRGINRVVLATANGIRTLIKASVTATHSVTFGDMQISDYTWVILLSIGWGGIVVLNVNGQALFRILYRRHRRHIQIELLFRGVR